MKTIQIWPDSVPGSIENKSFKQTVDSADNWIKMRFVTHPVIDFYQAPTEKSNGSAVIICPGGGYWGIAVAHEGAHIAEWFNSIGVSAFVLKYRLPDNSILKDKSIAPLQDGQQAIRMVRHHAKEWNIDPDKIGIMGFSAGGHIAATVSTHFNENVYEPKVPISARPDFSILIYPVISMNEKITHMGSRYFLLGEKPSDEMVKHFSNELQVTSQTPPAFVIHSLDDGLVPVQNSINYALAMKNAGVPCELHVYPAGGHGYGLGRSGGTECGWPEACKRWMKVNGFLK